MDPSDFNTMMAQYGQQQPSQPTQLQGQVPQQQAAPHPKGNWFTHALPTIGGILGGLGGEILDPFGGIVAAGGGSAAGKALENKLEGNAAGDGVLLNGVEGAAGQGVGGVLGKIGGKVLGTIGNKSASVADNLVKGQVTKGAIDGGTANTLRTMGASDSRQWQPLAEQITGQNGALNQGVEKTLMNNGHTIDVADLIGSKHNPNGLAESLISQKTAMGDNAGNKVLGTVKKAVQNMLGGQQGMIGKQVADPLDALQQSRLFADLGAKAQDVAYRTNNPEQEAVASVYKDLADELNQRIFTPGGEHVPLTDEVKADIINNLGGVKSINPTVHNNLVQSVQNANTLTDLRGLQAPFVQGTKAVDTTARAADRGAGTTAQKMVNQAPLAGAMAAGPHGLLAGLGASLLRSPSADRAMVPLVENGGRILSNISTSKVPAALGGATGVLAGTSNNLIQSNNDTIGSNMNPSLQNTPVVGQADATTPSQGLSRNDLITLALYSPGAFDAIMTNSGANQQKVAAANSAEQALGSLGQAPGGGLLSHITGSLGIGGTGEYQRKAQSAAEQVAAALPGTDAKAIEKQLTDYAAGGGNVDEAIKGLLGRLQSVVGNNQNGAYQQLMNYQAPTSIMGQVPVGA